MNDTVNEALSALQQLCAEGFLFLVIFSLNDASSFYLTPMRANFHAPQPEAYSVALNAIELF